MLSCEGLHLIGRKGFGSQDYIQTCEKYSIFTKVPQENSVLWKDLLCTMRRPTMFSYERGVSFSTHFGTQSSMESLWDSMLEDTGPSTPPRPRKGQSQMQVPLTYHMEASFSTQSYFLYSLQTRNFFLPAPLKNARAEGHLRGISGPQNKYPGPAGVLRCSCSKTSPVHIGPHPNVVCLLPG